MARLCLLDENGHLTGQWEIGEAPISVGRDESADVVIDDASLSRRHFLIKRSGSSFVLEDLGSINGTWVGGQSARRTSLKNNVCIVAGRSIFMFAEGDMRSSVEAQ